MKKGVNYMNFLKNATDSQKGAFFLLVGLTLLLFISGILVKILYYPLLISSFGLIIYGVYLGDFLNKTILFINKQKRNLTKSSSSSDNKKQ